MNRIEFDLLCVNILALANNIFSKKSSALISEMEVDCQSSEEFDSEEEALMFNQVMAELGEIGMGVDDDDVETLLKEGYESLDELKPQFDFAYKKLDNEKLQELLTALPSLDVNLKAQISVPQFEQCTDILMQAENEAAFSSLNGYIDELFYDPSEDLIMECLAEEKIEILLENADTINNDAIDVDNLRAAVIFNALDILQWLAARYAFKDDDKSMLMNNAVHDGTEYFEKVLNVLAPDEAEIKQIISMLEKEEMDVNLIQIAKLFVL